MAREAAPAGELDDQRHHAGVAMQRAPEWQEPHYARTVAPLAGAGGGGGGGRGGRRGGAGPRRVAALGGSLAPRLFARLCLVCSLARHLFPLVASGRRLNTTIGVARKVLRLSCRGLKAKLC